MVVASRLKSQGANAQRKVQTESPEDRECKLSKPREGAEKSRSAELETPNYPDKEPKQSGKADKDRTAAHKAENRSALSLIRSLRAVTLFTFERLGPAAGTVS